MSRQLADLETLLAQLVVEHRKLLVHVDAHGEALKKLQLEAMAQTASQQEASRLRIAGMESRRRLLLQQLARQTGQQDKELTITRLAELFPPRAAGLVKQRDDLRDVAQQISHKSSIAARVAGAVLGHLNTAVRLIAGAVEQAGVYTKSGTPKVTQRIGVMEAVG